LQNGHENGEQKEESDLFKIEVPSENPFDLFKLWYKQAEDAGVIMPHALNLATSDGYFQFLLTIWHKLLISLALLNLIFSKILVSWQKNQSFQLI